MNKINEVFGITRDIPLNYVSRHDVDRRLGLELDAGHHVVIYGSSKQGKTCLRKKCLSDDSYILVQCSNKSDLADLNANILKRAGFELTQVNKKTASGKNKVSAKLKAGLFGVGGSVSADGEAQTTEEVTTAPLELDVEDVNDVISALKSIEFDKVIVLEDFHYLPYETQRDFSVALKSFHETSKLVFVIVGVWLEDNRLIVFNGDLTGRVVSVNADKWSDSELLEVIDNGASLMGVRFNEDFKSEVIKYSRNSVYLVQEACRRTCIDNKIDVQVADEVEVGGGVNVKELIEDIVNEQTARYTSFLTNFSDGFQATELEVYRWVLYPILTSSISDLESGLRYQDIRACIQEVHPRGSGFNVGNLTQALKSSASLQSKKDIMPIIIDYNQTGRRLNIVDKGFLIWLQHQNVEDLLSELGINVGKN